MPHRQGGSSNDGEGWVEGGGSLRKVAGESPSEKVTFELSLA